MNASSIDSLKAAVESLAQSLKVETIFPSGLFVLVNTYFIIPLFDLDLDFTTPQMVTVLISLTLMLSYMLYAFNFPLIRVFEGYKFREVPLLKIFFDELKANEEDRFKKLKREKLSWRLDRDFPSKEKILPTKIGNVIAAFEEYPETHYGMDAIALWPRLAPVLKSKEFLNYVIQEKAVFDFLLNMYIVSTLLGFEVFFHLSFVGNLRAAAMVFVVTFVVTTIFYEGMYVAARQWGTVVKVAFDLHRHDLALQLALKPATTFKKEWARWKAVSSFLLHRKRSNHSFDEFIPQSETLQFKETMECLGDQS